MDKAPAASENESALKNDLTRYKQAADIAYLYAKKQVEEPSKEDEFNLENSFDTEKNKTK